MNKLLLKHILGIPILVLIIFASDYICPIRTLTGIHCMGCGITSAYLCVLNLDFVGAFNHHALYLIVPPYAFLLIHLHTPLFTRISKGTKYTLSIGFGSIIFIHYLLSIV